MSEVNAKKVLCGTFLIKKTLHEVLLEEAVIKWRTSSTKARTTTPWDVTVQLQDVLCVEGSLNSTEKKATAPHFSLHYISKKPNHRWSHETVTFLAATPEEDIDPWLKHIEKYFSRLQRPQRLLVFINPVAGAGTGVKTYDKVAAPLFKLCDVKTDVIITENGEHTGKVLDQYDLSSIDGIVSVGGDGTFSQAFNGLLLRMAKDAGIDIDDSTQDPVVPSVPIGLIPAGTGEWMAYNATWTSDPVTSTLHIITGQRHMINMGSVRSAGKLVSFGTIVIGQGISGETIRRSQEWRYLGAIRYLAAFIWTFIQGIKSFDADIHFKPLPQQPTLSQNGFNPEHGCEPHLASSKVISTYDASEGNVDSHCPDAASKGLHPAADGWHIREGSFSNLAMFLKLSPTIIQKQLQQDNSLPPKPYSPAMPLHQIDAGTSVLSTLKELIGLGKEGSYEDEPPWGRQHDKVRVTHALEYKVVLNQNHTEDFYSWINIDGESYKIEDRITHVKFHKHLLPMFGTGLCSQVT